jgi:hypothetical protein
VPLISSLQLTLIIPKAIETALFVINIYLINKKNKGIAWKDRPQFHKSFLLGMVAWTIFILADIFIYTLAGLSMDEFTPFGTYQGYDPNFPSLFGVNILRDIAFVASLIMCWSYLIAAFSLRFDEERVKSVFTNNKVVLSLMIVITIVIAAGDIIKVSVSETGISVSGVFNGFAGFSIGLNVLLYVISALMLFRTISVVTSDDPSKLFKRRIKFFMWGVIFMGIGHIYWLVLGLISIFSPSMLILPKLFYFFLGHSFWTISPALIYLGFGKGYKAEEN